VAPGALLHVLTIGVSDVNANASQLKLHFADKDAHDVANALLNTQTSLYAGIKLQDLENDRATRTNIIDALDTIYQNLAASPQGRDLVVVLFSGHGGIIDDRYFLMPYDVDARTPSRITSSALSIDELRAGLTKLAERAKVLVLLDACRSGAASADGKTLGGDAKRLRAAL